MDNKLENNVNFDVKIDNIIDLQAENKECFLDLELINKEVESFNMLFKNKLYIHNLTDGFLFENNMPTEKFGEFYKRLSKSGVGLIFTGGVIIYPELNKKVDKWPIFDENVVAKWNIKTVLNQIHSYGAKVFCTLTPGCGRLDNDYKFANIFNYSSSFNKSYFDSSVNCVRLSDSKCNEMTDRFGRAASVFQNIGFDGVLIDGSIQNILGEFTSGEFNRRVFGYFSNYEELAIRILKSINKTTNKFPIVYKITLLTLIDLIYENTKNIKTLNNISQGLNLEKIINFLVQLVDEGVDGFIFEFGMKENEFLFNFTPWLNIKFIDNFYHMLKNRFKQLNLKNKFNEDIQLFYKGNHNDISNNLLINNDYDFIDITRLIYSDLNYLKNKKTQNIANLCIKCCKCNDISQKKCKIECMINPELNASEINKNNNLNNKKVLIIGAGLSGIICAITLAERGFKVDLFDKNNKLNNSSRLCEIYGFDINLKNYNNYIENKLNKYIKKNLIKLYFDNYFSVENNVIKNYNYVVMATGFHEKFLNITGAVLKNVKSIYEVFSTKKYLLNKNNILVYAKSELSLKFALYLASIEKNVSVIAKDLNFMFEMPNAFLTYYLYALKKLKIKLYAPANIKRIHDDSTEIIVNSKFKNKDVFSIILNMKSGKSYSQEFQMITIDSDLFVYEPEIIPNNKLYYDIVKSGYEGEVYMVGNALEICDMGEVIKSGFYVGKNI